MRLCLLGKRKRVGPFLGAEPVCCHDFRVYTCKRASSGGKTPEEAVKSNAGVHGISFHNAFNLHPFSEKVNRGSHLFAKKTDRFRNFKLTWKKTSKSFLEFISHARQGRHGSLLGRNRRGTGLFHRDNPAPAGKNAQKCVPAISFSQNGGIVYLNGIRTTAKQPANRHSGGTE